LFSNQPLGEYNRFEATKLECIGLYIIKFVEFSLSA